MRPTRRLLRALPAAIAVLVVASPVRAHDPPRPPGSEGSDGSVAPPAADFEELVIFGRSRDLLGEAAAGSEGRIDDEALHLRPIGRVGELLEAVPGLIATQHSGSGKSNQLFLRGFNLDHGTDFATYFDGVPVNLRSHGHGQGYTDLNFVIPELVESLDFRKGPYRADVGDFASAGASFMKTYDRLPESMALVTYGQYDSVRGLAASSVATGSGDAILALEARTNQGPYALDTNLLHLNGLAKWTRPLAGGTLRTSASAYHATWNSTDQIPARAIGSADPAIRVSRLGYVDPDLGGETTRAVASAAWRQDAEAPLALATWLLYYDFELFSNFTYFLDDPVDGDEFEQRDRRIAFGANAEKSFEPRLAGNVLELRTGFDTRLDRITDLGLFETNARRLVSTVRQDNVTEWSAALFAEASQSPFDWLTLVAGLRADLFAFDVDTRGGLGASANGGSDVDGLVSPKLALILRPHDEVELYLNGGGGFHSNDARGATIRIDPTTGDPVSSVEPLARQWGSETGVRWRPNHHLELTSVLWFLTSESELVFVGDAGTTEARGSSRRFGVELTGSFRPVSWLVFDAAYAWSDGRFDDLPRGRDKIPGGLEHVVSAGATLSAGAFSSSLRLRHFGAYPLVEDDTQRAASTTVVNLGSAYTWRRVTLELTVVNLFDSKDSDIQYFYASRLAGELPAPPDPPPPAESVAGDTHLHPIEPRQLRGTLKITF